MAGVISQQDAHLVIHIAPGGDAVGGVRQHLWTLVPHLERLGFRVEVVFLGKGKTPQETRERGIRTAAVAKRGRADFAVIARLARLLRQRRPEIVHTHTLSTNFYGRTAALLARVPRCVTTVHSFMGDLLAYDASGRFGNRLLLWHSLCMNRFTDRLVAVSAGVQDWLLATGVRPDRVRLIRCGIELMGDGEQTGTRAAARQRLGLREDEWVIGNVARAYAVKDQAALLEAATPILRASPSTRLVIVGDGPERPKLDARAKASGVASQVMLPGSISDARALMPAFDVFVLSSRMEGIPQSLLEAMAARRPVVATRVGGIPELVEDGVSGLLTPSGSPVDLRKALERVRGDSQLAAQLGRAARARVERDYDAAKTSSQMAELYHELLSGLRENPSRSCVVSERV